MSYPAHHRFHVLVVILVHLPRNTHQNPTAATTSPFPVDAPTEGLATSPSPPSASKTTHGEGGSVRSFDGVTPSSSSDSDAALQQQQQQLTRARALQEELEMRVLATHGATAHVAPGETSAGGVPALLAAMEAGLRLQEKRCGGSVDRLVVVWNRRGMFCFASLGGFL